MQLLGDKALEAVLYALFFGLSYLIIGLIVIYYKYKRIGIGFRIVTLFGIYIILNTSIVAIIYNSNLRENLTGNLFLSILVSISLILWLAIIYALINWVILPLSGIVDYSDKMAAGDLTGQFLDESKSDEIGDLNKAFNNIKASFTPLIRQIDETSEKLLTSAQRLANSSEEVNAASEEITGITQYMAVGAQKQTTEIIATNKKVDNLNKSFQTELKHIETNSEGIAEITNQVNMLALNASIEAA
ncbi:MAG: HAMP domain-containing protein, partial [Candidatus Hodarchaeales archaeon]